MGSSDPISARLVKLNNQLVAASCGPECVSREGLLDAFNVLYEECNTEFLKKHDPHIAGFVEAHRSAVKTIRTLRVNISDFEIKSVIGRGHFGEVHVVKETRTGDVYAMKTVKKSDCSRNGTFGTERNVMAGSKSVWLTALQYAFQDNSNLYFVMEYHSGGDLLGLLQRQGGTIPESAATFYIAELVVALNDLHGMGYVHRDIKPENILLDRCGHVKLVDFGSAAKLNGKGLVADPVPIGTPEYIAPEVLQCNENKKAFYGVSCDYWSVGVVAFQLTVGATPFSAPNAPGTYTKIMNHKVNLKFPADMALTQGYVDLIRNLVTDPNSRLSYAQILKHPTFNNVDFDGLRERVPPYVPKVDSCDDTGNFSDIPPKKQEPNIDNFKTKTQFSGRQLPFVGFSYTYDLGEYNRREVAFVKKNEGDTLLKEVECLRKRLSVYENCVSEKESLERKTQEQERALEGAESLRNRLEHDLANTMSECSALKRRLDLERKDRADLEHKALDLIKSAKLKWETSEKTKVDALSLELTQHLDKIQQLTATNALLNEQLQHALELEHKHKNSLENIQHLNRQSIAGLETCIDKIRVEKQVTIADLQAKLATETASNKTLKSEKKSLETAHALLLDKFKSTENNSVELLKNRAIVKELENKLKGAEIRRTKELQAERKSNGKVLAHLEKEREKNVELQQKMQTLKDDFDRYVNEKQSSLLITNDCYTKQIDKLRLQVAQTLDEKKIAEENLREANAIEVTNKLKLETLEDLLKRLESGVTKLEADSETETVLKQQIERLESQLIDVHQKSAVESDRLSQLQTKFWRTEKDLNNAEVDKRILKREAKELAQMLIRMDTNRSDKLIEHRSALKELNDLNENLGAEVVKLKGRIVELEGEAEKVQEKLAETEKLAEDFRTFIGRKDDTIAGLVKELEACQKCVGEVDRLRNEKEDLEGSVQIGKMEKAKAEKDLDVCERDLRNTKLNLNALREACTLLENQLIEYEKIRASYEDQLKSSKSNTEKLMGELAETRNQVQQAKRTVNEERSLKLMNESKYKRMADDFTSLGAELDSYKQQTVEFRNYSTNLTDELTEVEEKLADCEVTIKTYERQIAGLSKENKGLKEENSAQLTNLYNVKDSNYQLAKQVADLKKSLETLQENVEDLQDVIKQKDNFCKERELKSNGTIQQQTKLIDFLQSKVDDLKKKKTLSDKLFGHSKKENQPPTPIALSYKDLENLLAKERDANRELNAEIAKLTEKNGTKMALERLAKSPGGLQRCNSVQRMHHNIPHRYDSKLCTKVSKCANCDNNMPLGRMMKYCTECDIVVHAACVKFVPKTCGVPEEYVKHYTDMSKKLEAEKEMETVINEAEGWVKIPVRDNTGWEKHYACLDPNTLKIYAQPPSKNSNVCPVKTFELHPSGSQGTLILDPVPSEIGAPLAKSDLPFVIKVEARSDTTYWPTSSFIFMTLNVEDKEKWSKALQTILNKPETKYAGDLITKTDPDLDVNCLIDLDDSTKLLGTEQGLFSLTNGKLLQIAGPVNVRQICVVQSINLAVMIADKSSGLAACELTHLTGLAKTVQCTRPTLIYNQIETNPLDGGFHLFKASSDRHLKLCAATTKQIIIMDYDGSGSYRPTRILDTAEPASCILFAEQSLIVGANKFFEIDLANYEADEFLDVSDPKLNQATIAYKAGSFPLDIHRISNDPIEYLLCFREFGVFVDEFGRCSRVTEIKWSRLPRAFYFKAPCLYVVQFSNVEILRIVSDTCNLMKNSVDSLLNVESEKFDVAESPKYLGGCGLGGVYVQVNGGEIRLLRGDGCESEFSFSSSMIDSLEEEGESEDDLLKKRKTVTFDSRMTNL